MSEAATAIAEPYPRDESGRFLSGNNGGGRPRGSRNKLAEKFIADVHEDWQANGKQVIEEVRKDNPVAYLKVVAGVLPRQLEVHDMRDLSDEELDARLLQLAKVLDLVAVPDAGPSRDQG